jgi:general secretion pathway protein C
MTRPLPIALLLLSVSGAAAADVTLPERAVERASGAPACGRDGRALARGIRCAGTHCDVRRWVVDRLLANASDLATCARIVPWIGDGRPQGFKLYAVRPGSLPERLLLRNGDALRTVNGIELSSPDRALEVYTRARSAGRIALALVRNGRPLVITYRVR